MNLEVIFEETMPPNRLQKRSAFSKMAGTMMAETNHLVEKLDFLYAVRLAFEFHRGYRVVADLKFTC
jgi:hypothetical protein